MKRPKKYATKLWTKLATNFKLVRWGKTNRKRRREKYECKKSCSRPHTHRHTQAHTDTYICKWFYCPFVLLLFFLCFPPDFFCLRLLDTLLCIGIIMEPCCVISVNFFCYCQQQFFPNFPNLPGAPSLPPTPGYSLSHLPTLLSHSHSVDICWHHSAHCCRWCFCFVCILLGLFFFTFTI